MTAYLEMACLSAMIKISEFKPEIYLPLMERRYLVDVYRDYVPSNCEPGHKKITFEFKHKEKIGNEEVLFYQFKEVN